MNYTLAFDVYGTLIDTAGAYPGIGAEERHIAESIAVNLREMMMFEVNIMVTSRILISEVFLTGP